MVQQVLVANESLTMMTVSVLIVVDEDGRGNHYDDVVVVAHRKHHTVVGFHVPRAGTTFQSFGGSTPLSPW